MFDWRHITGVTVGEKMPHTQLDKVKRFVAARSPAISAFYCLIFGVRNEHFAAPQNRNAMRHGSLTPAPRLAGALSYIGAVVVALLLASCARSGPKSSITIDRQMWVDDIDGSVTAIAQNRHGDLGIAGYRAAAWAVSTDDQGKVLWKYEEPVDEALAREHPNATTSEFHGVVPLANGNFLLCGHKGRAFRSTALVMIIDRTGHVVEQRMGFLEGDPGHTSSSVMRCFRWDDGVALFGWATDGSKGGPWIIKLDENGVKQWQRILAPDTPVSDPIEVANHSLVTSSFDINSFNLSLARMNNKGEVVVTGAPLKTYNHNVLRWSAPSTGIAVITYNDAGTAQLHSFNDRLEQGEKPKPLEYFNAEQGFGYQLADHSLLLFGQREDKGAAIGWTGKDGKLLATIPLPQKLNSITLGDAIPLSENRFVAVACQSGFGSPTRGLFLSWITLK